jgi:phosphatidylglycerol lysyltransferase
MDTAIHKKETPRDRDYFEREHPVWVVTAAILVNGLANILVVLLTRIPQTPERFFGLLLPFGLLHVNRSLNLLFGVMLIYLAFRLHQRHRVGWWIALLASAVSLITHFLQSHLWYTTVSPAVTLSLLLLFRKRFTVRTQQRSLLQGIWLVAVCVAVALMYGTIGFLLLDTRDFGRNFTFLEALGRTLREFGMLGNADLVPSSRHAQFFLRSLRFLGLLTALFAAYSLFRSVVYRIVSLPAERAKARRIVEEWGKSPYDYFKVWRDKALFFSDSDRSFISYRSVMGTAVCLGDPVGPEDDVEEILRSFIRYCKDNGWALALLMPERIPMYNTRGFTAVKIGEGAVVDLEQFCEKTANTKYFRYVRRKLEGDGYVLKRYVPPHEPDLIDVVSAVSREWLEIPGHREFGFIQGSFERYYVVKTTLYILRDGTGKAIAFVNEVPSYREGEATVDMMRHRKGIHWGAMDYLFQGLMRMLREEGKRTFYLGMAGVVEKPEKGFADKAFFQLTKRLDWIVHSRGVRQFKEKFRPTWEDRYLVYYGNPLSLAKIALAVMRVL